MEKTDFNWFQKGIEPAKKEYRKFEEELLGKKKEITMDDDFLITRKMFDQGIHKKLIQHSIEMCSSVAKRAFMENGVDITLYSQIVVNAVEKTVNKYKDMIKGTISGLLDKLDPEKIEQQQLEANKAYTKALSQKLSADLPQKELSLFEQATLDREISQTLLDDKNRLFEQSHLEKAIQQFSPGAVDWKVGITYKEPTHLDNEMSRLNYSQYIFSPQKNLEKIVEYQEQRIRLAQIRSTNPTLPTDDLVLGPNGKLEMQYRLLAKDEIVKITESGQTLKPEDLIKIDKHAVKQLVSQGYEERKIAKIIDLVSPALAKKTQLEASNFVKQVVREHRKTVGQSMGR